MQVHDGINLEVIPAGIVRHGKRKSMYYPSTKVGVDFGIRSRIDAYPLNTVLYGRQKSFSKSFLLFLISRSSMIHIIDGMRMKISRGHSRAL
ncbi:MAG: hypothetical protein BWX80_01445 [Candidatus Hydrogenedentes bacterium ADurb.Bin101]|nr:MAG: hypothetical protein BWX80_01445 [Candidatus Hydrogenedentes bacterium ADurb.Bin101]